MAQYMLMIYENEVDPAGRAERERDLPRFVELHRSLREAGLLVGVKALRSPEAATSIRVRGGETVITDGPFAVTKEFLAGYYVLECADLDEALKHAAPDPGRRLGDDRGASGRAGRRVAQLGGAGRRRADRRGPDQPRVTTKPRRD